MYCVFLGRATATNAPGAGSVNTAAIADNAVTSAKLTYPLTTFSSTGIDDNATSNAMTIESSERVQFTRPRSIFSHLQVVQKQKFLELEVVVVLQ
jgi:hypothetical protein